MEIAWRPGIGDPTVTGWLTVGLYALAATLTAVLAAAYRPPVLQRPELRFWALIALAFTALAINKQLDLQSLFTDIGRVLAKTQGWYDTRHDVQRAFVLGVGAGSGLAFLVIAVLWLRSPWANRITQLGTALVIAFVAMRASSFHGMDQFISTEIAPYLRMNAVLEIGGISLVLIGSSLRLHQATMRLRTERAARFGLPS